MHYVDSALDPEAADRLPAWLIRELATASALTLRTGFYSARALGVAQDALESLLGRGGELVAVVGGDLLQCDVGALQVLLNLCQRFPDKARVFVVAEPAFQNAKTYHVRHHGGRRSAWVGSANFTMGGFATNLEAAVVLDSDDDGPDVVDRVCAATVAAQQHPATVPLDQAVLHQLERRTREARFNASGTARARPSALIVDHCHLLLDRLDRASSNSRTGDRPVLPPGFCVLDAVLNGGLRPGMVTVVASRPSAGRTTLMLNMLTHAAIAQRAVAGLFSFESTEEELVVRIASATTRIRQRDLMRGQLTDVEWSTLAEVMGKLADAPLFIDAHQPPQLEALCAAITTAVARDGLDLVAVDPPGLLHSQLGAEGHAGEVYRRLKSVAMQLRTHIVVTAELTLGASADRAHRAPRLDDLQAVDAVAQAADVVILLHRPDAHERDHVRMGEADLIVAKNRYGAPSTVTVAHQLHYARFASLMPPPASQLAGAG